MKFVLIFVTLLICLTFTESLKTLGEVDTVIPDQANNAEETNQFSGQLGSAEPPIKKGRKSKKHSDKSKGNEESKTLKLNDVLNSKDRKHRKKHRGNSTGILTDILPLGNSEDLGSSSGDLGSSLGDLGSNSGIDNSNGNSQSGSVKGSFSDLGSISSGISSSGSALLPDIDILGSSENSTLSAVNLIPLDDEELDDTLYTLEDLEDDELINEDSAFDTADEEVANIKDLEGDIGDTETLEDIEQLEEDLPENIDLDSTDELDELANTDMIDSELDDAESEIEDVESELEDAAKLKDILESDEETDEVLDPVNGILADKKPKKGDEEEMDITGTLDTDKIIKPKKNKIGNLPQIGEGGLL